ncbi:MAG: choice-of-anchor U domain-containing protein [Desulfatibacillaceae bacterium]
MGNGLVIVLITATIALAPASVGQGWCGEPPDPRDWCLVVGNVILDGMRVGPGETGYTVTVSPSVGGAYSPAAMDTDGVDSNGDYRVFVPMKPGWPGGARQWETARAAVVKNGRLLIPDWPFLFIGPPGGASRKNINAVSNLLPEPVAASGGPVEEGSTIQLSALDSTDGDGLITGYLWEQVGGPRAVLSDPSAPTPVLATPPVHADAILTFRVTVTDDYGDTASDMVDVVVRDNGIDTGNPGLLPFFTANSRPLAVTIVSGGELVSLSTANADSLSNTSGRPGRTPLGLISYTVKGAPPGFTATVALHLDVPAPEKWRWYKATRAGGWEDVTPHAMYGPDRLVVKFTWQDGGVGDSGPADGFITDPLAAGYDPLEEWGSYKGDGGCFLESLGGFRE